MAQEIPTDSYTRNRANTVQVHSSGQENVHVSLTISQQQMQLTFTAEQKAHLKYDIRMSTHGMSESYYEEKKVQAIRVLKPEDDKKMTDNLLGNIDHNALKSSVDRSECATVNNKETKINTSNAIPFQPRISIEQTTSCDYLIGIIEPKDVHIKRCTSCVDLNSISLKEVGGDFSNINGSKRILKRKTHKYCFSGNGRSKNNKLMRKSNVSQMNKYEYNFRKRFLNNESPLKTYFSTLKYYADHLEAID